MSVVCCKPIYNRLIGWALPSREACTIVVDTWQKHVEQYPEAKIVDLGAGSGIFTHVFNELGVPKENLLAVDLPKPSHSNPNQRIFWDIHREDNFHVDTQDILFVAWGTGQIDAIEDYVARGGKCVIILGEVDGCTLCAGYFMDNGFENARNDWDVVLHLVPAASMFGPETLSVNRRMDEDT